MRKRRQRPAIIDGLAAEVGERLDVLVRVQRIKRHEWVGWSMGRRGYSGKLINTGNVKLHISKGDYSFSTGTMHISAGKSFLAALMDMGNMGMLEWKPRDE